MPKTKLSRAWKLPATTESLLEDRREFFGTARSLPAANEHHAGTSFIIYLEAMITKLLSRQAESRVPPRSRSKDECMLWEILRFRAIESTANSTKSQATISVMKAM